MLTSTMTFSVIDPCNRTGKIAIPGSYVTETKGVTDFLEYKGNPPPGAKDLSLCLLFQKSRCHAGIRCNQVHVNVEFINDVRSRAAAGMSCCARHGDVHSTSFEASKVIIVSSDDGDQRFCLNDFAFTPSLEVALKRARGQLVRVQSSRLCRLHLRGGCKFGRDCKNIHLCPKASQVPAPQQTTPAPLGTAFRSLDISNRCESIPSTWRRSEGHEKSFGEESSRSASEHSGDWGIKPLSVHSLTGLEAFHGMRHQESDPLDIDEAATECSMTVKDLAAFVDALVECELEEMSSPQWLCA